MYTQRLDPAALQMTPRGYRGVTAYARAKRAQVALSREWARRLAGTGITFHAMHPGWVDTPGIAAALPGFHRVMWPLLRTPGEGADTIVWLAAADPAQQSMLDYAYKHRAVIERFGRFPHRNAILGRRSTAEEIEFLRRPGSGF